MTYRVSSNSFVAGFVVNNSSVVRAAPILKFILGMHVIDAIRVLQAKRWFVETV